MKKQEVAKKMVHKNITDENLKRSESPFVVGHPKEKSIHRHEKKSEKLEAQSKKAGFYVHGHKNYGDVYEA